MIWSVSILNSTHKEPVETDKNTFQNIKNKMLFLIVVY